MKLIPGVSIFAKYYISLYNLLISLEYSVKQILDLIFYLHALVGIRLSPFHGILKDALLRTVLSQSDSMEAGVIEKFFDNLTLAAEFRMKFSTFKSLYDPVKSTYKPIIIQLIKALADSKADLTDLTYVAPADPNIAKYLNRLLKTPAKMHPLNQSEKVIIVFVGGVTGFELASAQKAIEDEGLKGKVAFLSLE